MSYRDIFGLMGELVSEALGHTCVYVTTSGETIENVSITINTGKPVIDEYNIVRGCIVEAGILITDVPEPKEGDSFTDDLGRSWKVDGLVNVVTGKTYVHVVEQYL
ncbi:MULTISPECIES: hypothetical protein [Pseudoalteromonas]|uniref:hypothetical protein n=1 Tax=Pseudoalteromonas TaxID=53246 RepID=UPI001B38A516|nr:MULTISPECIES: hypothetical protein [Pseudoalteromonas]MBQ4838838.1 hypothetical protein [Pseudoalteromonas luteoviolacea]MCG7548579.1 hypothetical protein [Pseudoalteromonas sp. Of7M-16]